MLARASASDPGAPDAVGQIRFDALARRPVSDPEMLLVRIQQRMATGTLPCEDCVVTWYGAGLGRPCAVCDQRILSTEEVECDIPGGGTIYFHRACYDVWHEALTRTSGR